MFRMSGLLPETVPLPLKSHILCMPPSAGIDTVCRAPCMGSKFLWLISGDHTVGFSGLIRVCTYNRPYLSTNTICPNTSAFLASQGHLRSTTVHSMACLWNTVDEGIIILFSLNAFPSGSHTFAVPSSGIHKSQWGQPFPFFLGGGRVLLSLFTHSSCQKQKERKDLNCEKFTDPLNQFTLHLPSTEKAYLTHSKRNTSDCPCKLWKTVPTCSFNGNSISAWIVLICLRAGLGLVWNSLSGMTAVVTTHSK